MAVLINLVAFKLGWLACVVGAAQGQLWWGPVAVTALVGAQLAFRARPARELLLVAVVGAIGCSVEVVLGFLGVTVLPGHQPPDLWFALWFAAFWVNFAAILTQSLKWFQTRPAIAVVSGAISGPPAYFGAAALGALELPLPLGTTIVVLGVYWAIALPLVTQLAARLFSSENAAPTPEVASVNVSSEAP